MPDFKPHEKVRVIDDVTAAWLAALPPKRGAMALCYMAGIINGFNDMGISISEKAALELVYKCGLFVTANGGKAK